MKTTHDKTFNNKQDSSQATKNEFAKNQMVTKTPKVMKTQMVTKTQMVAKTQMVMKTLIRDSGCLLRQRSCGSRVHPLYHLIAAQKSRSFRTSIPRFTRKQTYSDT